jgi:hypothetical protein
LPVIPFASRRVFGPSPLQPPEVSGVAEECFGILWWLRCRYRSH